MIGRKLVLNNKYLIYYKATLYFFLKLLYNLYMINKAEKILKDVFGYDSFRFVQKVAIENILDGNDTFIIMPTGGGKSLCYQIPALIFDGLTIVISPLISLMKDQIEQLRQYDINAVMLNSSLSFEEYQDNVDAIRNGEAKLLYLAPETLLMSRTIELLKTRKISCFTIDEAHCVSEWGHDFRPEYRQIAEVREQFPNAVCIALTATATERVRADIKKTLNFSGSCEFMSSFNRKKLFLKIVEKNDPKNQLLDFLKSFSKNDPGIIYCFSRKQVNSTTEFLNKHGYLARPYHAGLDTEERKINQGKFLRDKVQIIVATIAFGMGINKTNVRFVVHYDLPKNIESYYQEIGRAGRDGLRAECLLLFGFGDTKKIEYFIGEKEGNEKIVAMQHLRDILGYVDSVKCRRIPLLNYFGENYSEENCGMCDNCVETKEDLTDMTDIAKKLLNCIIETGNMFGPTHLIDVLRGSHSQKVKKFNHDNLSVYAIGNDLSKKQWFTISKQLIKKGLVFQDPEYGGLKITQLGQKVIYEGETFLGIFPQEIKKSKKSAKQKSIVMELSEQDSELFNALRKTRKELANEMGVPPFVVFSDKSLVDMANKKPKNNNEFLDINGVGNQKMEKYGSDFLSIIKKFSPDTTDEFIVDGYTEKDLDKHYDNNFDLSETQDNRINKKNKKIKKHTLAGNRFNNGANVEELSSIFNVSEETIFTYLYKYLQDGYTFNPDLILNYSTLDTISQKLLIENFRELGTDYLAPIYHKINGTINYREIKIMRLYLLSKD